MSQPTYERLMRRLIAEALQSPDKSTQNAAVLMRFIDEQEKTSIEYTQTISVNEFPKGVVETPDRWVRPTKYAFVEHAERNAIYKAAHYGIQTNGATMIAVWASCADCARAIIQAGIVRLVRYTSPENHNHWAQSNLFADEMFHEAGVKIVEIDTPFFGMQPLLRGGNEWLPLGSQSQRSV